MQTFIVNETDPAKGGVAAQERVTFDDLTLAMNLSQTTSGNDGNSDGLNDPVVPLTPASPAPVSNGAYAKGGTIHLDT